MTNHIANYIGFSTSSDDNLVKTGNRGVWSIRDHFYNVTRNSWLGNYILASGGTESDVVGNDGKIYRLHTYTSPGTFNITKANGPVDVYIEAVAGGGGGAGAYGAVGSGGGGGSGRGIYAVYNSTNITGSFTATVGTPGTAGGSAAGGGAGGPTNITGPITIINCGGGGGGAAGPAVNLAGSGGAGGSLSVHPSVSVFISTSRSGAVTAGASPSFQVVNGVGVNTSSNLLFPVSPTITPRSAGGSGGGGSGAPGTAGGAGHLRIFYELINISPQRY